MMSIEGKIPDDTQEIFPAERTGLIRRRGVLPFNGKMVARARELRKDMTFPEKKLWYDFLRHCGYKFRRQCPIDHFIADFYCPALRLIIEVDGGVHDSTAAKQRDQDRDAILSSYGLKILRLRNEEVEKDWRHLPARLKAYFKAMEANLESSAVSHPPWRGGIMGGVYPNG